MRFYLSNGGLRAEVDSRGGELVSLKDACGTEYIWGGDPAFWDGKNPVLFPNVGILKDGRAVMKGETYQIPQHGFARDQEFSVLEQGADYIVLELRENQAALARYPYSFSLQARHQLKEDGFSTRLRVKNPGTEPMPFCIGTHTGFNCPLRPGERFGEYEIVFDQPEDLDTLLLTPDGRISHRERERLGANQDRFALDHALFARLDTVMLDRLHSTGVSLLHRDTGRGLRMEFGGFPMLAIWTEGKKKAPFVCLEAWQGCAAMDNDTGLFTDKPYCVVLEPGAAREWEYTVTLR